MAAGPRRCPSGARRQPPDPGHCSPRGHVLHLSRRPTGHLNERLRARWRPQGARRSEAPRDGGTQACSARPALSLPSTAAARLSVSPEEARSRSGLARARIPVRAGEAWPLRLSADVPLSSRPPAPPPRRTVPLAAGFLAGAGRARAGGGRDRSSGLCRDRERGRWTPGTAAAVAERRSGHKTKGV